MPLPLAVVAKVKSALRIMATDRLAESRGVRAGMSLADARGAVPELDVASADPAADHAMLEGIADWCDRYTPLVALDPPRGLLLDISGCAHLFAGRADGRSEAAEGRGITNALSSLDKRSAIRGPRAAASWALGSSPRVTIPEVSSTYDARAAEGEAALLADGLRRIAGHGFEVRGAIASTIGAARALAHHGGGGIAPAGGEAEAIGELPVVALRIDDDEADLLARLGLKRIGQLIGKPRAALASRFGAGLILRLDQALGHLDEVLSPRRPTPALTVERRFAEPVTEEAALMAAVAGLARTLAAELERHGAGARVVEAAFFRTDGHVARASVGTASPLRAPAAIARLFEERLAALGSEWDCGFGFDTIRLMAPEWQVFVEPQIDLAGEGAHGADLDSLVDRLGARLGPERVTRWLPVDTHIPERAVAAHPLAGLAEPGSSWRGSAAAWAMPAAEAETPPERPLRLFARPEPVADVIAAVPYGPPVRFRWRRVVYHIRLAEGPERIGPEWWRGAGGPSATRDYFRVEDSEGRRYWMFRDGLYGAVERPGWFIHGMFG